MSTAVLFCHFFNVVALLPFPFNTFFLDTSLLDIVKIADLFKVKVGEKTLGENEKNRMEETIGRFIEPSENIVVLVDRTMEDELMDAKAEKVSGKKS